MPVPLLDLIGYAAGALLAICLIPQVYKSWKTKSTKDISVSWTLLYMAGLFLWFLYGIGLQAFPIIIFAGLEFLMATSLFALKLIYR